MAFTKGEGAFECFAEAGAITSGEFDAILDDEDLAFGKFEAFGWRFVGAEDVVFDEDAEVALLLEKGEEVGGFGSLSDRDRKGNEGCFISVMFFGPRDDGIEVIGRDDFSGFGIDGVGMLGVEEFEVVVDLGDGTDGRAGGADVVFLLDGDGGRNALDGIDGRFVHAVEKLSDVG